MSARVTGWSAGASMNAAARGTTSGGTQPGPATYCGVIALFGKVSSMAAAAIRVSSWAISGLISVLPEVVSSVQTNFAVLTHMACRSADTGVIASNRRSVAGMLVRSSARDLATGHGTR